MNYTVIHFFNFLNKIDIKYEFINIKYNNETMITILKLFVDRFRFRFDKIYNTTNEYKNDNTNESIDADNIINNVDDIIDNNDNDENDDINDEDNDICLDNIPMEILAEIFSFLFHLNINNSNPHIYKLGFGLKYNENIIYENRMYEVCKYFDNVLQYYGIKLLYFPKNINVNTILKYKSTYIIAPNDIKFNDNDLSKLTNVKCLWLKSNNNLSYDTVSQFTTLEHLHLYNFKNHEFLKKEEQYCGHTLHMDNNPAITCLKNDMFKDLPNINRATLQYVNISFQSQNMLLHSNVYYHTTVKYKSKNTPIIKILYDLKNNHKNKVNVMETEDVGLYMINDDQITKSNSKRARNSKAMWRYCITINRHSDIIEYIYHSEFHKITEFYFEVGGSCHYRVLRLKKEIDDKIIYNKVYYEFKFEKIKTANGKEYSVFPLGKYGYFLPKYHEVRFHIETKEKLSSDFYFIYGKLTKHQKYILNNTTFDLDNHPYLVERFSGGMCEMPFSYDEPDKLPPKFKHLYESIHKESDRRARLNT
jgi:hypothetical protein